MLALEILERAKRDAERLRRWRLVREGPEWLVQHWRGELDDWRTVLRCRDLVLAEGYLLRKLTACEGGGGLDCRLRLVV